MNRRQFIQGGLASMAALTPAFAEAKVRTYSHKNITTGLSSLINGETGVAFQQKRDQYILAYFGTAHKKYKGCGEHLLAMVQTSERAQSSYSLDVLPVLVYPPIEPQNGRGLLDAYVRSIHQFNFVGLTADRDTVKNVGSAHNVQYIFKNGETSHHSQAAVLIGPDGTLMRKYLQTRTESSIDVDIITPDI